MKRTAHHHSPQPRVFSLTHSVGECGSNDPYDVELLQGKIKKAGYTQATGRTINENGSCTPDTLEAIRWFQALINMPATGLVYPTDMWFIEALENATSLHWRVKHVGGVLTVQEGQLTFDYEGVDYITAAAPFRQPARTPWFSRILHHPSQDSSVTLGRGFDMKKRTAGSILYILRKAGVEEYKAQICAKAAYLQGREADVFISVYGPLVGEITHQQQVRLFDISYREKKDYAKGVYDRTATKISNALSWDEIDIKIRDVFVDTIFQGNQTARVLVKIMAERGSKQDVINYLKTDLYQSRDPQRLSLRLNYLR